MEVPRLPFSAPLDLSLRERAVDCASRSRPMFSGWRPAGLHVFPSPQLFLWRGTVAPLPPSPPPAPLSVHSSPRPTRIIRLTVHLVARIPPLPPHRPRHLPTCRLAVKQLLGKTAGAQVLPIEGRGFAVGEGSG